MPELNSPPPLKTPVHPRKFSPLAAQVTRQLQLKSQLFGDPLLTLAEAAAALGSPCYSQLRKWIASGRLKTWRATPKAHHRIRLSELRRFIAEGEQGEKP